LVFSQLKLSKEESSKVVSGELSLFSFNDSSLVTYINQLSSLPSLTSLEVNRLEKKTKDDKYQVDLSFNYQPKI
jgi:hypothetical protein